MNAITQLSNAVTYPLEYLGRVAQPTLKTIGYEVVKRSLPIFKDPNTLFEKALKEESLLRLKLAAIAGANVNAQDKKGATALLRACRLKQEGIVKGLLGIEGIDVNKADKCGRTPLFITCLFGTDQILELLMKDKRVDINKTDKRGRTPFFMTCGFYSDERKVKRFLEDERTKVNKSDRRCRTPLLMACDSNRSFKIFKMLMNDVRINVSKATKKKITPLHKICMQGNVKLARLFFQILDRKKQCHSTSPDSGLYSNKMKNWEFDKEAPQNSGLERETIAERQGSSEDQNSGEKPTQSKTNFSFCLSIYYIVNCYDQMGNTPLYYAIKRNVILLGILLKKGADPSLKCSKGKTPIDIADENNLLLGGEISMGDFLDSHI